MAQDYIKITNLKVFAHHGVFPEETRDGQDFYVNAKLILDCRKAGQTDCLADSLNCESFYHRLFTEPYVQADRGSNRASGRGDASFHAGFKGSGNRALQAACSDRTSF